MDSLFKNCSPCPIAFPAAEPECYHPVAQTKLPY
jgi:hypothetical protein